MAGQGLPHQGIFGCQIGNNLAGGPSLSPQSANRCGVEFCEMDELIAQVIVNAARLPALAGGSWCPRWRVEF